MSDQKALNSLNKFPSVLRIIKLLMADDVDYTFLNCKIGRYALLFNTFERGCTKIGVNFNVEAFFSDVIMSQIEKITNSFDMHPVYSQRLLSIIMPLGEPERNQGFYGSEALQYSPSNSIELSNRSNEME